MSTRLVIIVDSFSQNGAARQAALLAEHLDPNEFEVHVAVLEPRPEVSEFTWPANVPVKFFPRRWQTDPLTAIQLFRHLAKLSPQLVHCWGIWSANYAAALGYAGIVTLRNVPESRFDPRSGNVAAWLQRKATLVFPCAALCALLESDPKPSRQRLAQHCKVIPPGIAIEEVTPSVTFSREEMFSRFGIPDDAWVAGTVGRLQTNFRQREMIWALDVLAAIRPHLHLVIVGDGADRKWLARFGSQVRRWDHVHLVGKHPALKWIPHFDSLWISRTTGGIPQTALEAMALGVPVIAADSACHREMFAQEDSDAECGLLYPPGISPELSKRAKWLIDEPARAERIAAAAREHVARRFSAVTMVQRYAELYRRRAQ